MFRRISFKLLSKPSLRLPVFNTCKKGSMKIFNVPQSFKFSMLWQNKARFCTSSANSGFQFKISPSQLDEYINKVDNESWNNVLVMLAQVSVSSSHQVTPIQVKQFFDKVAERFINREYFLSRPEVIIDLGYFFGVKQQGSREFWDELLTKFYELLSFNKYDFGNVAKFLNGATQMYTFEHRFWKELENLLLKQPTVLTPLHLSYILPAMVRHYTQEKQESLFEMNTNLEDNKEPDIEEDQLWVLFKDAAVKQVKNMNGYELSSICWSLAICQHKEPGFWMSVEERFNEIKSQLKSLDWSYLAYSFGLIKEGSDNFWQETEEYILESLDSLSPGDFKLFINGFASAQQGTLKFWNSIQQYAVQLDLSPADLVSVLVALSNYEIYNPKTWAAFESQVMTKISDFTPDELSKLINAYGQSDKGNQKVWNAIEERILKMENLPRESKLILYMMLKDLEKITPDLAEYFQDVTEIGDKYTTLNEEGAEEKNDEEAQQNAQ